jgi:quinol monooxygenase YgiN
MDASSVRFVVSFAINEGSGDRFERMAALMSVEARKEPGTLAYQWYLDADGTRCRLFEAYVNADAVLAHLTGPVVQELVPKLLENGSIGGFEIYGDPGPKAAAMLAGLGAAVFPAWHGFAR